MNRSYVNRLVSDKMVVKGFDMYVSEIKNAMSAETFAQLTTEQLQESYDALSYEDIPDDNGEVEAGRKSYELLADKKNAEDAKKMPKKMTLPPMKKIVAKVVPIPAPEPKIDGHVTDEQIDIAPYMCAAMDGPQDFDFESHELGKGNLTGPRLFRVKWEAHRPAGIKTFDVKTNVKVFASLSKDIRDAYTNMAKQLNKNHKSGVVAAPVKAVRRSTTNCIVLWREQYVAEHGGSDVCKLNMIDAGKLFHQLVPEEEQAKWKVLAKAHNKAGAAAIVENGKVDAVAPKKTSNVWNQFVKLGKSVGLGGQLGPLGELWKVMPHKQQQEFGNLSDAERESLALNLKAMVNISKQIGCTDTKSIQNVWSSLSHDDQLAIASMNDKDRDEFITSIQDQLIQPA